jgi:hypothetical protein
MSALRPLTHKVQAVVLSVEQKTKMTRNTRSLKRNNSVFLKVQIRLVHMRIMSN